MRHFMIIAALLAAPATAQEGDCLTRAISMPAVKMDQAAIEAASEGSMTAPVAVAVENISAPALAGIMIDYELWSNDRPAEIAKGRVNETISIPGGLMPGESFNFQQAIWLDGRALEIALGASNLELRFTILNALSTENARHEHSPTMLGWSSSTVSRLCE